MEIIRLRAKNDRNGNPRRVFVAIEDGDVKGVFDEGYSGSAAVPESFGKWRGITIDVTPSEYRRVLKVRGKE